MAKVGRGFFITKTKQNMANSLPPPTPLHVLNLHARGMTMVDAWAVYNGSKETEVVKVDINAPPPKLSAKEKKEAIKAELIELGADLPAPNASAAKWSEALAAAKEDEFTDLEI